MFIKYLFTDANLVRGNNKPSDIQTKTSTNKKPAVENNDQRTQAFIKRLNLMKASSTDNSGLLNKLASCLTLVNQIGQVRAVAQVWREFVLELRFRYDSSILISGLNSNSAAATSSDQQTSQQQQQQQPDLSRCLLHQKVQMLNCCIRKRLERKAYENAMAAKSTSSAAGDSEEEFFDCDDDENQFEGRLKKCANLTLLNNPNEPIYIPVTQVSLFLTSPPTF